MLKILVWIFVREEHWAANQNHAGRSFNMDFLIRFNKFNLLQVGTPLRALG
jgi:hypothetical protein